MTSCCARNAGERDGAWGLGVRGPPSPGAPGSAAGAAFLTSERRAGARQLPWGSAESGAGRRGLSTPGRCCRRLPRTLRGPRGRGQRPTGHGWGGRGRSCPTPAHPVPLPFLLREAGAAGWVSAGPGGRRGGPARPYKTPPGPLLAPAAARAVARATLPAPARWAPRRAPRPRQRGTERGEAAAPRGRGGGAVRVGVGTRGGRFPGGSGAVAG